MLLLMVDKTLESFRALKQPYILGDDFDYENWDGVLAGEVIEFLNNMEARLEVMGLKPASTGHYFPVNANLARSCPTLDGC